MARLIDDVLGHRDTWRRLETALRHGHLPHAMAFTGPSGVGKRAVARALAQALLCEADEKPCGVCGACRRVAAGTSEAVLSIEPEKNQIKLEAAHDVLEFLALRRVSRARVILINEAQLMNPQTANACLKVIEEPPPDTYFILVTPEISQLLPTLRSRSQVVRFGPLGDDELKRAAGGDAPEPWMIKAARGSVERLASLREPEAVTLRETALTYLRDALAGRRAGLASVLTSVKDRERTLATLHFLQQALRDWSVDEMDLGADVPNAARVALWRQAHQMEADVLAHVDRGLVFENFFNRARNG